MVTKTFINNSLRQVLLTGFTLTTLAAVIPVSAADTGDGPGATYAESWGSIPDQERQIEIQDLQQYSSQMGIIITADQAATILDANPGILDDLRTSKGERKITTRISNGSNTARFEVVGDGIIQSDELRIQYAGGYFHDGVDTVALLNYSYDAGALGSASTAVVGNNLNGKLSGMLGHEVLSGTKDVFGVFGFANIDVTGTNYGVYGSSGQADGYGGYFVNNNTVVDFGKSIALYARGNIDAGVANLVPEEHIAVFENTGPTDTSVLALYMSNVPESVLGADENFLSFYADDTYNAGTPALIGAVQGNGSGGVELVSAGADMAEYLERRDHQEQIEKGDIVGIIDGQISKDTRNAHAIQVISSGAIVAGNAPDENQKANYDLVTFIGQAPVKVMGSVQSGDYIVASGKNDGTGIALSAEEMADETNPMLVGRAWESSPDKKLKLINVAIGLNANYSYIHKQNQRITRLESRLSEKTRQLDRLTADMKSRLSEKTRQLDRLTADMEMLTRKVAYIQSDNMVATSTEQ